ncbi:MAG: class I SAM-dependent methyltransferase, partial [Gemmatimonadaceae bacterium]
MLSPSEIPVLETLSFVLDSITAPPCRLLEVGCGAGELAARLGSHGFTVVAIDSDADAVHAARDRGVDARVARWPEHDDAPFDAVLFTRSLHHLQPLPPAVARARELLAPSGVVIVEDFAFHDA